VRKKHTLGPSKQLAWPLSSALASNMNTYSFAKQVLEMWGIQVKDIPESTEQESDFLAYFDSCTVLIEEKTKLDNPDDLTERHKVLSSGQVHGTNISLHSNNRISGIIGKAASQLESSSKYDHDLRIIWFTGIGVNHEAQYEQFISTIYGSTKIIEMNNNSLTDCYFFRNSEFFRYSNTIDGAVAAHTNGEDITLKLCLNPLSRNYEAIKSSSLSTKFGTAVTDPCELESSGHAYIVDGDINRKDQQAVFNYLQSKYNTEPLNNMDFKYASATVLVPNNER